MSDKRKPLKKKKAEEKAPVLDTAMTAKAPTADKKQPTTQRAS
jgi:hypothetical protein